MEFLLVGDSKLKILLDDNELKKYKLDSACADACDSGFRRSFWKILERAKESTGFDVGGDKILIQFYPLKDGGCEFFVTKLGLLSDASARMVSRSDKITMLRRGRGLYSFSTLEDVIAVSKIISEKAEGVLPESDLFFDGGHFFLAIDEYGKGGDSMEFPFIIEYGSAVPHDVAYHVFEHAELNIKENAVKRLSEL